MEDERKIRQEKEAVWEIEREHMKRKGRIGIRKREKPKSGSWLTRG